MEEGYLESLTSSSSSKANHAIPTCYGQELTSSFVVWLELIKYVWKPERPTMDQTEKKHTTASSTVSESRRPTEREQGLPMATRETRWQAGGKGL